jgi:Domain of unknown function (DUF6048)
MKHTLKYTFSLCLLLSLFMVQAQDVKTKNLDKKKQITATEKVDNTGKIDTIGPQKTDRYGLRVGADLYKLTRGLYDKNYKGLELVGDYRLTKKYFLAAELGNENKTTADTRLNTTAKGSYLKVGFDYNGYENWLNMENIISVGMRYGVSTFDQEINSYRIYNPNPYFGEMPLKTSGEKFSGLTASWIEVVAGVKVKVINNFFVGFSLRMNTLVTNHKPADFDNLYIPGFNRTYNGGFGAGINYTVTYFVPIYKKKVTKSIPITKKEETKK